MMTECAAAAAIAIAQTGAAILLTRSEQGMSLFASGKAPVHLAAKAREVFDVSGAGDTVAATVALGIASGLAPDMAMQLANIAAGSRGRQARHRHADAGRTAWPRSRRGIARWSTTPGAISLEAAQALREHGPARA